MDDLQSRFIHIFHSVSQVFYAHVMQPLPIRYVLFDRPNILVIPALFEEPNQKTLFLPRNTHLYDFRDILMIIVHRNLQSYVSILRMDPLTLRLREKEIILVINLVFAFHEVIDYRRFKQLVMKWMAIYWFQEIKRARRESTERLVNEVVVARNAVEDYHHEDYRVKHCKDHKCLVLQGLRKPTSPHELGLPTIENISHQVSHRIVPNIAERRRETIKHQGGHVEVNHGAESVLVNRHLLEVRVKGTERFSSIIMEYDPGAVRSFAKSASSCRIRVVTVVGRRGGRVINGHNECAPEVLDPGRIPFPWEEADRFRHLCEHLSDCVHDD